MTCKSTLHTIPLLLVIMFAVYIDARGAQSHTTAVVLLQMCKVDPAVDSVTNQLHDLACNSYLNGWLDAFVVVKSSMPELGGVCLPSDGVPRELVKAIVVKWLLKHEEETRRENRTAAVAVLQALAEEYPCPRSQSK